MRDGVRAIEFLERLDAEPDRPLIDVVLLDLNLPKISGEEVLKRVRMSPKCEGVKVLIISSSDIPADRERMMKLGASDYFRKPSDLAQFMLFVQGPGDNRGRIRVDLAHRHTYRPFRLLSTFGATEQVWRAF